MIEFYVGFPGFIAMARFAVVFQSSAVHVVGTMAAAAILAQLLCFSNAGVAGVAVEPGVHAQQCKFGFGQMIVFRLVPGVIVVATGAVRAETQCMRVVRTVASRAVLGQLVLEIRLLMTGTAVDDVVPA